MAAGSSLGDLFVNIIANNDQYNKAIDGSKKKTEKFEGGLTKLSGTVKKLIGAGVLVALAKKVADVGKASIKAASEAVETRTKFNTAFKGIEEDANAVAKNLVDNYGLATVESQKLLSSTGDLIKGFGANSTVALDTSEKIQKLSVDLADYNTLQGGASRASEILTKAYLGERESLIALGIKISEADVKQRLLEKGQKDLTGQALLLAKGNATLELAVQQSGDAIGSFARSAGSYEQAAIKAKAATADLSVQIGRALLPSATSVTEAFSELTQQLTAFIKQSNDLAIINNALKEGNATLEQKLEIVKRQKKLEDEKFLRIRNNLNTENEIVRATLIEQSRVVSGINAIIKKLEAEIKAKNDILESEAKAKKAIEDKQKAEKDASEARTRAYVKQNDEVNKILAASQSEIEAIDKQIEFIDTLALRQGTYYDNQQEAIRVLQEEKQRILDEETAATEQALLEKLRLEQKFDAETRAIREATALDIEAKRIAEIEGRRETAQFIQDSATNIASILSNFNTAEINGIEESKNAKINALNKELLGTEEYNKQKVEIEKVAANKVYEIELQQFNFKKALALSQIAIDTAIGVAKVYGQTGIFGLAAQIPVIASGLLQAAIVVSEPAPPKPAFAQGGVATAATSAVVGESGGEVLLGMGAKGAPLIDELASRIASKSGSGRQIVINQNNMLNLSNEQGLSTAAEALYDQLEIVKQRRGVAQ